jgi:glycosyltransferase involved in cell wall biosynthesis
MMENSQNTRPLVSICIPVFNGEATIRKTIDSIINQTYKNLEIIIVDNCSTDSTVKIVREFQDSRIRLILNEIHLPCAENNWNRCFHYVRGEFMAIFHADDVYLPQMVSQQIGTFMKFPQVSAVFTLGNIINEIDDVVGEFRLPTTIEGTKPYPYPSIFLSILEHGDFLLCPSAMLRTDLYVKLYPFRYDSCGSASDLDMWLRAAKCTSLIILDEKLMHYRVSKTQGTYLLNCLRTKEADFFTVMDYHIEKNKNSITIEKRVKNRYDLFLFEDQLKCALSYIYKGESKTFKAQLKKIQWSHIFIIYLTNPQLAHPKFSRGIYGKMCQLPIEILRRILNFKYHSKI